MANPRLTSVQNKKVHATPQEKGEPYNKQSTSLEISSSLLRVQDEFVPILSPYIHKILETHLDHIVTNNNVKRLAQNLQLYLPTARQSLEKASPVWREAIPANCQTVNRNIMSSVESSVVTRYILA